jgi:3-oxoacyl-(acyl-carrier-protein) synthase
MSAVVAVGAISALGRGEQAFSVGRDGEPARVAIADDPVLAAAGLRAPRCARAPLTDDEIASAGGDRATALLLVALGQVVVSLDAAEPGWRSGRVGFCVGTSSGGMLSAEQFFAARHRDEAPVAPERATYFAPFDAARGALGLELAATCQVVAACASSTIAVGLGMRWLERDACDLVIAGGYDAVSAFVAAGFEAIRATTATVPRPFRLGRDGMVLGEGAGLMAFVPSREGALFHLGGFGASADATHITAPDRAGAGLQRAGRRALDDAACPPEAIDVVSAHATATPYNDAAEAKAIAALFGPRRPWVHPFKAQIGHCLGAAGVLELLALSDAIVRQRVPAAAGEGAIDPEAEVALARETKAAELNAGLKISAAFGGVTAGLVVARERATRAKRREGRRVGLMASASVTTVDRVALSEQLGVARDRLARIDDLGQLAIAAVAALAADVGTQAFAGAGIVGGHALATLDTNERFERRRIDMGARRVDPRLFPATSPNAGAGHCSILFRLTGPCFAVNGGLDGGFEALEVAAELVAAGDVERMLVVVADDAGPASLAWRDAVEPDGQLARGAVAALLVATPDEGLEVPLGLRSILAKMPKSKAIGHRAVIQWLAQPR